MLNRIQHGTVVLGLILPLITQADPCSSTYAKICDVTFNTTPTFANLCTAQIESGTYIITNNTSVPLKLNYIRIEDLDTLPATASTIGTAPTNNCSTSIPLAPHASCNIVVTLQPSALGTYNRILQVGINTRQVEIDAPAITAAVNCTPSTPPTTPTIPGTPTSLFQAAILGSTTVTNTGPSVITGDVDLATAGSSITGFPPGTIVSGNQHIEDGVATTAHANALAYYNALIVGYATCLGNAPSATGPNLTGFDLGTLAALSPGTYCFSSSAQLTGTLTLNGAGNYIFQIGTTLTTATNSQVLLSGGATDLNVNWAIGSSATLGNTSTFVGIIDAVTSITFDAGSSTLNGRAWALNGAVSLNNSTVTP